jgi:hypothetical protein
MQHAAVNTQHASRDTQRAACKRATCLATADGAGEGLPGSARSSGPSRLRHRSPPIKTRPARQSAGHDAPPAF